MKNKIGNKLLAFVLCAVLFAGASCKKLLDIKPEDEVDISNAYLTQADADAAVLGIYGKFANLASQYIILNELRADLMDVTNNADPYLKEINTHNVTSKNPYANPRPIYELIMNCNDALKGFNKMVKESRLSVQEYDRRYSDIGALRSWLYLQLGIHYGSVPYITESLESVEDLAKLSQYPKVPFNVLIDSLINFTSGLGYDRTQTFTYPTGNTLNFFIDGNNTRKFYITIPILRGDLYLWKGQYLEAAKNYKIAMDVESSGNDINFAYRVAYDGNTIVNTVSSNGVDTRNGKIQDTSVLFTGKATGWRSMFAFTNTNRSWNAEWYWSLPYGIQFATKNKLPRFFSKTMGSYLLKPSHAALDNWQGEMRASGTPGDPRGLLSQTVVAGDHVITKFTDDDNSLLGGGQWNIWRAGGVHLRFAEAANRDNKSQLAWGLLNGGIANALVPTPSNPITVAEVAAQETSFPEPYYFDARDAGANNTSLRQPWSKNTGIRNRAWLSFYNRNLMNDVTALEDALIKEASLELAFEGQRWADLLRIAMRRDQPDFLAEKVYQKLLKSGNPAAGSVRQKLLAKQWFLPFDIYE
ncbi:MAG: RagB/SusD family nutrient uptake outer membrane protein [Sphingobacteriaceae bacterium]|nr:RagB/SusD family nutrient uptake outer membrane protein [Sphingobacteriaceae bacterium]